MGHHDGLAIVEITVPSAAEVITFIPGPSSLWRDVKTYQDHAYIVSEGGGWVQVVNLSDIDNGVATLVNTFGEGVENTHNVVIDETSGLLARAGAGSSTVRAAAAACGCSSSSPRSRRAASRSCGP